LIHPGDYATSNSNQSRDGTAAIYTVVYHQPREPPLACDSPTALDGCHVRLPGYRRGWSIGIECTGGVADTREERRQPVTPGAIARKVVDAGTDRIKARPALS